MGENLVKEDSLHVRLLQDVDCACTQLKARWLFLQTDLAPSLPRGTRVLVVHCTPYTRITENFHQDYIEDCSAFQAYCKQLESVPLIIGLCPEERQRSQSYLVCSHPRFAEGEADGGALKSR